MKIACTCFLLALASGLAYAQGTINFNNKVSAAGIDAPVWYYPQSSLGGPSGTKIDGDLHQTALAALYGGPDGTPESQLVLLGPAVGFRSGLAAGYVNVGSLGSRSVPGTAPGAFAIVQVRAWDTLNGAIALSWEDAIGAGSGYFGKSALLRIKTGGDIDQGGNVTPPANLIGLQQICISDLGGAEPFPVCPEPCSSVLLILGLICAVWFRAKNHGYNQRKNYHETPLRS